MRTIKNVEDVLKALEICFYPPSKCSDCPYDKKEYCEDEEMCETNLCRDAYELLKFYSSKCRLYEAVLKRRRNANEHTERT